MTGNQFPGPCDRSSSSILHFSVYRDSPIESFAKYILLVLKKVNGVKLTQCVNEELKFVYFESDNCSPMHKGNSSQWKPVTQPPKDVQVTFLTPMTRRFESQVNEHVRPSVTSKQSHVPFFTIGGMSQAVILNFKWIFHSPAQKLMKIIHWTSNYVRKFSFSCFFIWIVFLNGYSLILHTNGCLLWQSSP